MQKPKIIVFTTAYYPFIGGAEIAIQEIVKRLKDRFDFCIITARFRSDLPKREVRPEGTVIRVGLGSRLDKWLFPLFYVQHRVLNMCVQHPLLNILWGVDIGVGSFTAAIFKLFRPKTPFIFNIQYGHGEERLSRGRWGLIALTFRFILGQADYVTAISTYLFDLAREYGYQGPGEVIPNGVDIYKFKVQSPKFKVASQNSKVVITTSRLVPKNGIDILVRAMAEVKKEIPDVRCHVIGEGGERKNLELEIRNLKLENIVKLFGQVPHDELPKYLAAADIFVRPSRSEGMGNSFVEALAAGLPIVGTPVGGIGDIIKDGKTGLLAKADDPQDLAEKVKTLLQDQKLANSIVENGRRMVEERFSWDKIAVSYGEVFSRYVQHRVLNILVATPLYPPQLGGPALYAKHLGGEFGQVGQKVRIVSFGHFLRYPGGLRHLLYFFALLRHAPRSDIIFALDYTSVGFPAAMASLFLRKTLVIRVEGDSLWESFVERTRQDITLPEFYKIALFPLFYLIHSVYSGVFESLGSPCF